MFIWIIVGNNFFPLSFKSECKSNRGVGTHAKRPGSCGMFFHFSFAFLLLNLRLAHKTSRYLKIIKSENRSSITKSRGWMCLSTNRQIRNKNSKSLFALFGATTIGQVYETWQGFILFLLVIITLTINREGHLRIYLDTVWGLFSSAFFISSWKY